MNILSTLSEAIGSANAMERESSAILDLCREGGCKSAPRLAPYTPYLRRRDRVRRAVP